VTIEIINHKGNSIDTIFHSLVLDPKKFDDKEFGYLQSDPKSIIPNFVRGDLLKYVEEYNTNNSYKINEFAYATGSKHIITWGLSENHFLLYVGGEGEWYGNKKI